MRSYNHVRFEFHPGWSTEARVIIDSEVIPIHVVRPVWTPQNIDQPVTFAEWNWTWLDGNRYQLRCHVPGIYGLPSTREQLRKNDETIAEGFFRGPLFVKFTQQWSWRMGRQRFETCQRISCRPRSSLRDGADRCLAVWYRHGSRIRGVIRGSKDVPCTPLLWGMVLSTMVKPGPTIWNSVPLGQAPVYFGEKTKSLRGG